ncbi:MAG: bifunctional transaldolase/phosoglucose isomerase [Chloroflexi bacterium]|nr:bifunctional transaldolase/phosoglucose isomerase [Chloroflexota bacterium]
MKPVQKLTELGQSLWIDNIQRSTLLNGDIARMIANGDIEGMTSNPSIFSSAVVGSNDYDAAIQPMAWAGLSSESMYNRLIVEDIQTACDLFQPVYQRSQGRFGFLCLEVDPNLAHDLDGTIADARRLWKLVARPNVMIKIPATQAGVDAYRQCAQAGINVCQTIVFSLSRLRQVLDAYMDALEARLAAGQAIDQLTATAAIFISRIDNKIDPLLKKIAQNDPAKQELAASLVGKVAVANATLAYITLQEVNAQERFQNLKARGAQPLRLIWGSTGTKDPSFSDVKYIEELIAPDTINTVPGKTLKAFLDHGNPSRTLEDDKASAQQVLASLESLGIDLPQALQELEDAALVSFNDAYHALLDNIAQRAAGARNVLLDLAGPVQQRIQELQDKDFSTRLHAKDPSLWKENPAEQSEITNRMGWLEAPQISRDLLSDLQTLVQDCLRDGYTHALLLGMGGSSLAPEVMARVIGPQPVGEQLGLQLNILDSTDPAQVSAAAEIAPPGKTVYIVSSKSGTTSEVNAMYNYFWEQAEASLGVHPGQHFIAITDPGTPLEARAREQKFRAVFLADPNVGGRNSALTAFGLVPAALLGINVAALLDRAAAMAQQCAASVPPSSNPGIALGAVFGEAAQQGRDKLSLITDPDFEAFGSWLEQLIAESSGKEGRGIVPVDIEPHLNPTAYGKDRLFVYVRSNGAQQDFAAQLLAAGQPVITLDASGPYALAAEFYRWEVAIAVACSILGVNSFNQPDVQDNKTRTTQKIKAYRADGLFDEGQPVWQGKGGCVYGMSLPGIDQANSLPEIVALFLQQAHPGDYVALNAYLPRDEQNLDQLQKLRQSIMERTGCATTLGFGPRFLHSTGQLHKGGPDKGMFLQITQDPQHDLPIPGEGITFGTLERAQALGDLEALMARGRRTIRIHLKNAGVKDLIA